MMSLLPHILLFTLSLGIVWALSGILVNATDRVAKRYKKPGFALAFIVLGLMTSVSEMSVAVNSSLHGVPELSAGNLAGGSLVIFLFIIPLLAIAGGGISMNGTLSTRGLVSLIFTIALPSLLMLDGTVQRREGVLMLLAYGTLLYIVKKRKPAMEIIEEAVQQVEDELLDTQSWWGRRKATLSDILKILFAGALIFGAGKILVHEAVYFAGALAIPASLIGLIVLSIGTNAPELVIAVRCIIGKRKDIAFGDYMGSAAANTFLFGLLSVGSGTFPVQQAEVFPTFLLLCSGLVLFFIFSRSKQDLSRGEGAVLLAFYALFLILQFVNFAGGV